SDHYNRIEFAVEERLGVIEVWVNRANFLRVPDVYQIKFDSFLFACRYVFASPVIDTPSS
ncbi:MAG: hypothetical protein ACKO0X_10640, partial [Bacteroidota bacterium]